MWLKLMPGVYLGVPADDRAFGQCEDCTRFRACRDEMMKEARMGSVTGIDYWQMVLKQACLECWRKEDE